MSTTTTISLSHILSDRARKSGMDCFWRAARAPQGGLCPTPGAAIVREENGNEVYAVNVDGRSDGKFVLITNAVAMKLRAMGDEFAPRRIR